MKESWYYQQLEGIKGLNFFPWIGNGYGERGKLLIVGESDYMREEYTKENQKYWTRSVIEENLSDDKINKQGPLFTGLQKAIIGREELSVDDKHSLWNSSAFINLSQRILKNSLDRPTYDDFNSGWYSLFKVIDVIKPEFCIVLSLGMASFIEKGSIISDGEGVEGFTCKYGTKDWDRSNRIGSHRPARLVMRKQRYRVPMIFIKHPSKYFNWQVWSEYIGSEMLLAKFKRIN